jgi:iron-sulfur cluster repair protein YtfE (RIC family)
MSDHAPAGLRETPAAELPTAPLRRHHEHMAKVMERMLELIAEAQPDGAPADPELLRGQSFLERTILPHAEAEDCFLYPEVARLMANHQATAPMTLDHAFISQYLRALRSEVDAATAPDGKGLTAPRLCGLHQAAGRLAGLLRTHFEKEEQVYFPLIDANMTTEEARRRIVDPINAMAQTAPPQPAGRRGRSG